MVFISADKLRALMFKRSFLLFSISLVILGGCASAIPKVEENEIAKLNSDNNSIVLIYTSLNDAKTAGITVARKEDHNRYVMWRGSLAIKFPTDPATVPGQLKIPAGEYGIVEIHAYDQKGAGLKEYHYVAPSKIEIDGLLKKTVYERPLAKFSVGAGEVVDIGFLQVIEQPRAPSLLVPQKVSFTVKAGPTPDAVVKNLAQRNPNLAKARVVRTMVADGNEW